MSDVLLVPGALAIASLAFLFYLLLSPEEVEDEGSSSLGSLGSSLDGSAGSHLSGPRSTSVRRVAIPEERARRNLRNRLVQAGLYRTNSKGYFLMVQTLLAGAPIALAFGLSSFGVIRASSALLMGLAIGISGVVFPGLWLDARKKARQTAIRRSLPDALDVIVVCVEAGLSVPAALLRVTDELRSAHPLLSRELAIVHKEVQLGAAIGPALRHFADRFDLEELRSLSAVVQQAERYGASIANALRVHAESLRERRLQAARERAQKAAVILLIPTVLCIFPAMFVVILGPAVYRVIEAMQHVNG